LESLAYDPILAKCKLIAEAWDAGGLYQVGSFPAYGRWAEWNGKYRDCVRQFLKGDAGQVGELAQRIQGSPDLYGSRGPTATVNFLTCHDGFTLHDMFSYNYKHNEANGERNADGSNDNYSWNCGWEGHASPEPHVEALRCQMKKNAFCLLMLSRGVPMFLMGDEFGRTQRGNNNAYCLDNQISWVDWTQLEHNAELHRFVRTMIAFRRAHPVLQGRTFFQNRDSVGSGLPDFSFHGTQKWYADFSSGSRCLAFLLCGKHSTPHDSDMYIAMNMYWDALAFEVPHVPDKAPWHVAVNTSMRAPDDIYLSDARPLADQTVITVGGRSIMVLITRR
jgi:glycogen operon protein